MNALDRDSFRNVGYTSALHSVRPGHTWCIAFAGLLCACEEESASNPMGNGGPVPERFQAVARMMESERLANGISGAALAIVEGGKVTFSRGFGSKDPNGVDEVEPSTLFRIGSCSKMLTAIAVLQTVADGKVRLDHPVTEYVPDFHFTREGTTVAGITVRHLLTHTSGIVDTLGPTGDADNRANEALGRQIAGDFAAAAYPMVPPGTFYNYANPNFMLLGRVGEVVTQQPYRTLMQERVLLPLGMQRTYVAAEDTVADGDFALSRACSESEPNCDPTEVVQPETSDEAWLRPPGGIWSSVLDLGKLAKFLLQGNEAVLSSEQWQSMTSAQVSTLDIGDRQNYGFGVVVSKGMQLGPDKFYPTDVMSHGGAILGYGTYMICVRSWEFCVITLATAEAAQFGNTLGEAFSTLPRLPKPSRPPEIKTYPERYADYAGTYSDAFDIGEVRVWMKDKKLHVTIPKFDANKTPYVSELTPAYGDTFVAEIDGKPIPVTFIPDETGKFKYIRTRISVPIRVEVAAP